MARQKAVRPTRPARKHSQAEIMAALENDIVSGRLKPRQRVDEREVAARFGVSRTPVREVLNRMATTGILDSRRNQGMFVAAMTLPQLLQMYEVLSELEALCARLAARRMTPQEKRNLLKTQSKGDAVADTGSAAEYAGQNMRFHEAIYVGTHNPYLANMIRLLRRRLEPYRRFSFQIARRIEESHAEHSRIAKLISDSNQEAAGALMREHMDLQRRNFDEFVLLLSKNLAAD
jgi:DNA-binding GntR family transcriptional regulator